MSDTYEGKDRTSPAPSSGVWILPTNWPELDESYPPDWFIDVNGNLAAWIQGL